jgi:hypothetical protein
MTSVSGPQWALLCVELLFEYELSQSECKKYNLLILTSSSSRLMRIGPIGYNRRVSFKTISRYFISCKSLGVGRRLESPNILFNSSYAFVCIKQELLYRLCNHTYPSVMLCYYGDDIEEYRR